MKIRQRLETAFFVAFGVGMALTLLGLIAAIVGFFFGTMWMVFSWMT